MRASQVTTCVCCDQERRKKSAGKKPKEKSDKTKVDNFVWTDDEVQLLLELQMTRRCRKGQQILTGSRASQSTLTFLNYIGNTTHHLKKSLQQLKKNTQTRKKRSLRSY